MGVQYGSKTICEFDIDENGIDILYTNPNSCFMNFSSSVYYDKHLYITGGTQNNYILDSARNTVTEFTFKVKETTGKLTVTAKNYPPMKQRRMKHSQVIVRDHLFVMFGYRDKSIYADTLEYLNLLQEEPEQGEFKELKIENYDPYHVEPMIFPANVCETLDDDPVNQKETILYFFGGEIRQLKRSQKKDD